MKLRNKKTGEIIEVDMRCRGGRFIGDNSLAELNKEWEDYKESKDHWHIGCEGDIFIDNTESNLKIYSSIGNDFDSREEAEKVVEKLKAWKRLKDKGFRFIPEASYVEPMKDTGESMMLIACTMNDYSDFVFGDNADIKLLFGDVE